MIHFQFKWLLIWAGLYSFIVEKCNAEVVMKSRRKIYSVLYITVVTLIITASLIQRMALVEDNGGLMNTSFTITYSCINLIGQVTVISFAYKADLYVVLVNRMDEFDKELKKLHVVISNNVPFWFIICHVIMLPIACYAIYIADRSFEKKLIDLLSGIVPIMQRCLIICIITTLLLFFWQRCHGINLLLEELDDALLAGIISDNTTNARKKSKLISEQKATDILSNVTVLLEQLVDLTELIKDIFSVIIFINLALLILLLSIVIFLYMYYQTLTEISQLEYFLMLCMYTVQTLELYILCFLLETETKNICITLGLLNLYYLTPKLAFMKNTLLLQGLHKKVDMNLFGIIPLRPSIFLKQLDVCKTIMLLLLQYYQKSQRT